MPLLFALARASRADVNGNGYGSRSFCLPLPEQFSAAVAGVLPGAEGCKAVLKGQIYKGNLSKHCNIIYVFEIFGSMARVGTVDKGWTL